MAVTDDFFRYVLEQLSGLSALASRRMFGAVGLYSDGAFFGLISSDVLYFKVGDANRPDYEARGMGQFRPFRDRPQISMSYYEVPAEVLEEADECMLWARRSIAVAHSAPADRPLRSSRRPKTPSA
ncbi:MAG TPA: TfoX/Sxy family protein [Steroidobacteraceae bacterium]|nr:TfoX/Sxy family protein [Steroidobacteraceae bacterium]